MAPIALRIPLAGAEHAGARALADAATAAAASAVGGDRDIGGDSEREPRFDSRLFVAPTGATVTWLNLSNCAVDLCVFGRTARMPVGGELSFALTAERLPPGGTASGSAASAAAAAPRAQGAGSSGANGASRGAVGSGVAVQGGDGARANANPSVAHASSRKDEEVGTGGASSGIDGDEGDDGSDELFHLAGLYWYSWGPADEPAADGQTTSQAVQEPAASVTPLPVGGNGSASAMPLAGLSANGTHRPPSMGGSAANGAGGGAVQYGCLFVQAADGVTQYGTRDLNLFEFEI
jgi:hypothetical protein